MKKILFPEGSVLFACMPWMLGMDRHGLGELLQSEVRRCKILELKGNQQGAQAGYDLKARICSVCQVAWGNTQQLSSIQEAEIEYCIQQSQATSESSESVCSVCSGLSPLCWSFSKAVLDIATREISALQKEAIFPIYSWSTSSNRYSLSHSYDQSRLPLLFFKTCWFKLLVWSGQPRVHFWKIFSLHVFSIHRLVLRNYPMHYFHKFINVSRDVQQNL